MPTLLKWITGFIMLWVCTYTVGFAITEFKLKTKLGGIIIMAFLLLSAMLFVSLVQK